MKYLRQFILSAVIALLVSGCAVSNVGGSGDTNPRSWGNYKCDASPATGGRSYTGWATGLARAKKNALSICSDQTHAINCVINSCRNED